MGLEGGIACNRILNIQMSYLFCSLGIGVHSLHLPAQCLGWTLVLKNLPGSQFWLYLQVPQLFDEAGFRTPIISSF